VQPGREGGLAAEGRQLLPDAHEHVLRELVGVASAGHAPHEAVHARQVSPVELLERAYVSRCGTGHVRSRLRSLKGLESGPPRPRLLGPCPATAVMASRT